MIKGRIYFPAGWVLNYYIYHSFVWFPSNGQQDDHLWHWFSFCPCVWKIFNQFNVSKASVKKNNVLVWTNKKGRGKINTAEAWKEQQTRKVCSTHIQYILPFFSPYTLLCTHTSQRPSEVYLSNGEWADSLIVTSWREGKKQKSQQALTVMRGQWGLKLLITNTQSCKEAGLTAAKAGRDPVRTAACGRGTGRNKWGPGIDITSRVSTDSRFFFNMDLCNLALKLLVGWEKTQKQH